MISKVSIQSRYVFWLATGLMLLSVGWFELLYAAFGKEVLSTDVKIALLIFTHMCLYSLFQLFSGTLIDHYGSKRLIPVAALCIFTGMVLQIHTSEHNFHFMMVISQIFMTFGSSFSFIGVGYLSYGFFDKALAGVMFGFIQTLYSLSRAVFWGFSSNYGTFLKQNFKLATWCVALLQFAVFLVMIFVSSNPQIHKRKNGQIKFGDIISRICGVVRTQNVLIVSAIAGIKFGVFFAVVSMLIYKTNNDIGSIASMFSWIGFAVGSPLICWIYSFLGVRSKNVFLMSGLIQGSCLLLMVLLTQKISGMTDGHTLLSYANYATAIMLGVSSGGHMVAFSLGRFLVSAESITTYYAVVNGITCVLSGAVILVVIFLAQFFPLSDMLIKMAVTTLILYPSLVFLLHKNALNV